MHIDRLLERLANSVVIIAAIGLSLRIGVNWVRHRDPSVAVHRSRNVESQPLINIQGISIDDVRPVKDLGGIILFVSPSCRFCEDSVPFYQRLSSSIHSSGLSMLVAVTDRWTTPNGQQ